jgi:DNA polymerase V
MRGGSRLGAGRPKKEETKVVRIPLSKLDEVKGLLKGKDDNIPLYMSKVRAGFPSPADDFIEQKLNLNDYLIKHPASTFLVRAEGESMVGAGIQSGNILVVDRSLEPTHNRIVIAALDGELTVKRLYRQEGVVKLLSENPDFPPIHIREEMETVIWGVVTNVIAELI